MGATQCTGIGGAGAATILENLRTNQDLAVAALGDLEAGTKDIDDVEVVVSMFRRQLAAARRSSAVPPCALEDFQQEAGNMMRTLKAFTSKVEGSAAEQPDFGKKRRTVIMPEFRRRAEKPFTVVNAFGKQMYAKVVKINSMGNDASILVSKIQSVHRQEKLEALGRRIARFIDDGKCGVNPMYAFQSLQKADVIIAVKDLGRRDTKIISVLLGEIDKHQSALHISVLCSSLHADVGNVGRVALSMALKYADDNNLDVELDALADVIPYYARDGFKLRASCKPGAKVLPLEPPEIAEDLRTHKRSVSAERFLAKTVPAGLAKACRSDLFADFSDHDDAASTAAVKQFKKNHCNGLGFSMTRCQSDRILKSEAPAVSISDVSDFEFRDN